MDLYCEARRSACFARTFGPGVARREPDRLPIARAIDEPRADLARGMGARWPADSAARPRDDSRTNIRAQLGAPASAGLEQAAGQQLVRAHGARGAAAALRAGYPERPAGGEAAADPD